MNAYFEKLSLMGLEILFKASRISITQWLKKSSQLINMKETLLLTTEQKVLE